MALPRNDDEASSPLTPEVTNALVANHRRFLAFLEKRVGNRAVAEEILQAAYVRTIESETDLSDGEGAVAWFYRLLRNAIVDHYRRRGTEGRALEREAQEAVKAYEPELKATVCACMHDLLPALKPEYAELVRRVDLEEGSVQDVAASLGITANNAGVRLHRARKALRDGLVRACGTCADHGCLDCSCGRKQV